MHDDSISECAFARGARRPLAPTYAWGERPDPWRCRLNLRPPWSGSVLAMPRETAFSGTP
ncbi:hypothetical protein VULLAG_LOCUS22124 [Vulpes lagopus]